MLSNYCFVGIFQTQPKTNSTDKIYRFNLTFEILSQENKIEFKHTAANLSINSSEAPREAIPISWENCANSVLANIGAWPINS